MRVPLLPSKQAAIDCPIAGSCLPPGSIDSPAFLSVCASALGLRGSRVELGSHQGQGEVWEVRGHKRLAWRGPQRDAGRNP